MAVLVGLVASNCEKNDYYSQEICAQTCEFTKRLHNHYVKGICKISSTYKIKYGEAITVYRNCWRCFLRDLY